MKEGRRDRERQQPEAQPFSVVDRRFSARTDEEDESERHDKPTFIEELEKKLEEKDRRLTEVLTKHREAVQEFENARARLSREVGQEVEQHKKSILVELLDIVDNLDRALEAAPDNNSDGDGQHFASLRQGVELVRDQFLKKLEGFGVSRAASMGAVFDPSRHEAVSVVPVTESSDDGMVVGVIKDAYLMGDDVLRPASVAVGRMEQNDESS